MAWFLRALVWSVAVYGIQVAGTSPCVDEVNTLVSNKNPGFVRLTLSTGKSIPFDAGKYVMCEDGNNTRYFLVSMQGSVRTTHAKTGSTQLPMKLGFCVPDVCDHAGVVDLVTSGSVFEYIMELTEIQVQNVTTQSPELDLKHEDTSGLVAGIALMFLISLVVISTCIVFSTRTSPPARTSEPPALTPEHTGQQLLGETARPAARQGFHQRLASTTLVKAFTLLGDTGTLWKLVEPVPYQPTHCLNGMRVLNMAWIILGHTFLMPTGISGYQNLEDVVDNPLNSNVAEKNPLFQLILAAQAGVDTFFFLSGFLLAFLTLEELRRGKMNPILAIVMRYFRLTPSLALVLLVYYKIWVFWGYGPFAVNFQDSINRRCDGSWWSELTYTMNFIPFDSDKVCMGWSWYLGDDMIFFIITILLLPVYHRTKLLGWALLVGMCGVSFVITTVLVVSHDLSVYVFDYHYTNYSYWAYSKPYTRIPAYFVGVMAAWLIDELKDRGITRLTRPDTPFARIVAKVAAGISLVVLFGCVMITFTDFGDHKNSWSVLSNVLYINFSRPIFAMAWAVISMLCYYGYLPWIDAFLSHWFWTPLARLTYGAYLVHPLVIKLAAGRSMQFYNFNAMDISYRFVGNLLLAHLGSVGLWVLCERPCITISSSFRKSRTREPKVTASSTVSRDPSDPETPSVSRGVSLNRVETQTEAQTAQ